MRNTLRLILLFICSAFAVLSFAEQKLRYETCVMKDEVKTLRIRYAGTTQPERPVLTLGSDEQLEISFDELSHDTHNYTYTVLHLNADGTESSLSSGEFLRGFTTQDITDYMTSLNTQQLYTHYSFLFPNDDMQPTVSGNYALKIYEDGDRDNVVAYVCFSVVEPMVNIDVNVRGNTDIELSGRYQQLDIDVSFKDVNIVNPAGDITLLVRQNGRTDNEVFNPKPTYVENHRLRYINQKQLIFEAGNEFRHFDIASQYFKGYNVDKIHFDRNYYHAFLFPDEVRAESPYLTEYDANGQYVVHAEKVEDDDTEADYMWVHFLLPTANPWFTGGVFVSGDLTYNCFMPDNRMQYDNEHKAYVLSLYLKQGAYDYQYLLLEKGKTHATTFTVEGSYWQTQNEYTVYVYYHPFGSRADRLIGVKRL